mmetsp:Transcript_44626/g.100765  ORF Transcript_44626/g.100765 Transcript_44626/m.100765 type:complete len:105 (+) Transcript_44626:3117-3431(+)
MFPLGVCTCTPPRGRSVKVAEDCAKPSPLLPRVQLGVVDGAPSHRSGSLPSARIERIERGCAETAAVVEQLPYAPLYDSERSRVAKGVGGRQEFVVAVEHEQRK